jgi:hypothetical protein
MHIPLPNKKYFFYFTIVFFLFCQSAFSHDYYTLISQAEDHYQEKSYAQSVKFYQKAFKVAPGSKYDLYGAACAAALNKRKDLALTWLKMAFEEGYVNIRHIKTDTDLDALHQTAAWKPLIADIQKKVDQLEAGYNKPLQKKLIEIYDEDQKHRLQIDEVGKKHGFDSKEMNALWNTINETDSINLLKIKEILNKEGWVGEDQVGAQANSALFLVIQHADLATQQEYLPIMRDAVKAKKAQPSALALLEDRVALGEKRLQIYGSQIGEDSTGKAFVLPLKDPDQVDQRRASVGLGPLASYVRAWDIKWNVAEYKKALPALKREQDIDE